MPKGKTKTQKMSADQASADRWHRIMAVHALAEGDGKRKIGVDREKRVIHGWILAQKGPFKSEGRGEFDDKALALILQLAKAAPNGLKSRLAHPDESNDGIGKLLGRVRDPWPDIVGPRESEGSLKTDVVPCVRGDLHLDPSASKAEFDMAEWLMTACESDPQAISSSLVLRTDREFRLNPDGTRMMGPDGEPLPPLWRPTELHATDCVDTGDAVDGVLSASLSADDQDVPNGILWKAETMLNKHFADKPREFVEGHLTAYLDKYLNRRYGLAAEEKADEPDGGAADTLQETLVEVLAVLRAQAWLYHTAHWQTAGPNFYGLHLLFERLYSSLPDQYDGLAEKLVAMFGADVVDAASSIQLATGYVAGWSGEAVASGLTSEASLSSAVSRALALCADNAGLQNFLQGLADEHQTNVYLLQQVQGGVKPAEAMAARPLKDSLAKAVDQQDQGIVESNAIIGGDDDDEDEDEEVSENPARDGCRSSHGLHYTKQCSCGAIVERCGCKHADLESRVVRVRDKCCPECMKTKDAAPADSPDASEEVPADAGQDVEQNRAADRRRRELAMLEANL
jgi:DNA-binding ferritin-like protein